MTPFIDIDVVVAEGVVRAQLNGILLGPYGLSAKHDPLAEPQRSLQVNGLFGGFVYAIELQGHHFLIVEPYSQVALNQVVSGPLFVIIDSVIDRLPRFVGCRKIMRPVVVAQS